MLGCLVPSKLEERSRKLKPIQLTIFHLSVLKKQFPIFKWEFVDLYYPLKGWAQYDYVKKYLVKKQKATPKPSVDINPFLKAVKDIIY